MSRPEKDITEAMAPLGPFEPGEVLREADDRVVMSGRFAGRDVVVKRFREQGPERVAALRDELDFVVRYMNEGRNRMMQCLAVLPEEGLAVLERAPGRPLQAVLAEAGPVERARLVRRSGEWLRIYTDARRRVARFGPRHWLGKCEARDLSEMAADDVALMGEVVAALRARLPAVRGAPLVRAATHGDFTSNNLLWDGEALWGVDVQGESWLPLAKEAALFLVWLELRRESTEGARINGIRADDWRAFLRSGLLRPSEAETVLPFLVGVELHAQFCRAYAHEAQRDRLKLAIGGWLEAMGAAVEMADATETEAEAEAESEAGEA